MPIRGNAKKVMKSMKDQYGEEKGKEVFYATANKQERKPETWKKKASSSDALKQLLTARKGVKMAYFYPSSKKKKSLLGDVLKGALVGGGAGLAGGALFGAGEGSGLHGAARAMSDLGLLQQALPSRGEVMYAGAANRAGKSTLIGAGLGGLAGGILHYLLSK